MQPTHIVYGVYLRILWQRRNLTIIADHNVINIALYSRVIRIRNVEKQQSPSIFSLFCKAKPAIHAGHSSVFVGKFKIRQHQYH